MWSTLVALLVLSPFHVLLFSYGFSEPCEDYAFLRPGQDRPTPFCYLGKDKRILLEAEHALIKALARLEGRLHAMRSALLYQPSVGSFEALIGGPRVNLTSYIPPSGTSQLPVRRFPLGYSDQTEGTSVNCDGLSGACHDEEGKRVTCDRLSGACLQQGRENPQHWASPAGDVRVPVADKVVADFWARADATRTASPEPTGYNKSSVNESVGGRQAEITRTASFYHVDDPTVIGSSTSRLNVRPRTFPRKPVKKKPASSHSTDTASSSGKVKKQQQIQPGEGAAHTHQSAESAQQGCQGDQCNNQKGKGQKSKKRQEKALVLSSVRQLPYTADSQIRTDQNGEPYNGEVADNIDRPVTPTEAPAKNHLKLTGSAAYDQKGQLAEPCSDCDQPQSADSCSTRTPAGDCQSETKNQLQADSAELLTLCRFAASFRESGDGQKPLYWVYADQQLNDILQRLAITPSNRVYEHVYVVPRDGYYVTSARLHDAFDVTRDHSILYMTVNGVIVGNPSLDQYHSHAILWSFLTLKQGDRLCVTIQAEHGPCVLAHFGVSFLHCGVAAG